MKIGVTPFFSRNRKKLLSNIVKEDVIYPSKEKYSIEYSEQFMDVVNSVSPNWSDWQLIRFRFFAFIATEEGQETQAWHQSRSRRNTESSLVCEH